MMYGQLNVLSALTVAFCMTAPAHAVELSHSLRVCADPNNLPFSDQSGRGFENRLAELIANAMGEKVEYTWWAQRRGFMRNTLSAGLCDVVMGVPKGMPQTLTTQPYYRSSYAIVYRKDSPYHPQSLEDPGLGRAKIGIHLVGDGISPPAEVLAAKGIIHNVVGYSLFGDYRQPNPPARLIEAVASGQVDLAVAWGPLAGYFAQQSGQTLEVVPLLDSGQPELPFQYSIAIAVRPDEPEMRDKLDQILIEKKPEIDALLAQYHIPVVSDQQHALTPDTHAK